MGTGDLNSDPQAFPLKTSPTWPSPAPTRQLLFSLLASCFIFLKVVRVSCRQHNLRRHKDVAVGLSGQSPRWVTRLTPEGLELSITEYLTVKVSLSELCLQKVLKPSSHCKVSWRTSTKSHVYETLFLFRDFPKPDSKSAPSTLFTWILETLQFTGIVSVSHRRK